MRVYFDNAATTPLSEEVSDAMLRVMRDVFGNPSSIHADGRKARATVEEARKKVAHLIGASIGEVFFTSGGTESNNMALKNAVRDLGVRRIISSPIEHHCVLHTADRLATAGVQVERLPVDELGRMDYAGLEARIQTGAGHTLVSLMHANNEIGTMIDLRRVGDLCREAGVLFHSDTVQTMGHFPFDLSQTYLSFCSGSAHKFHGPKGTGFIYINNDNQIEPFIDGGSQERNMRAGTENIAGIVGLATALELACREMEERKAHILGLRSYLAGELQRHFTDIRFNGEQEFPFLYTVLSVSFPPSAKSELLLLHLDIAGISASGGSACSSGAEAGSHVLEALGGEPDRKTIRFSFSHYNTREEIDFLIGKMKGILG